MSISKQEISLVIASTLGNEHVIVSCPSDINELLNGVFCCDNNFINENIIPKEKGLYELNCELLCDDDQDNIIGEPEPEWEIKIVKFKSLFKLRTL